MAVDLSDLVPALTVELGPTTETNAQLVQRLSNAFWEARLNGLFKGFMESDGLVVPTAGTEDLGREYQQLIVLYAAYSAYLTDFKNAQAQFSAEAGPVRYSTQRSAGVMREVLAAMRERLGAVVAIIGSQDVSAAYAIDALIARTEAIAMGETWWVK